MTRAPTTMNLPVRPRPRHRPASASPQRGVVLIIALIMLVVISLLAALSIRNATSTAAVSGNVRTTELATQSAEIALRYCEDRVAQFVRATPSPWASNLHLNTGTFTISFDSATPATAPVIGAGGGSDTITIQAPATPSAVLNVANWDGNPSGLSYALPLSRVNSGALTHSTYRRPPECMVERMPVYDSAGTADYTSTFQVTARGFGPEVSEDDERKRPDGSEVWLQSTITITAD